MPSGKVKMYNADRGFGFIQPNTGGEDLFFHVSDLQEGDDVATGAAVTFELGNDRKTGRSKATSVDLV